MTGVRSDVRGTFSATISRKKTPSAGRHHQQEEDIISRKTSSAGRRHHQQEDINSRKTSTGRHHQQEDIISRKTPSAGRHHQQEDTISRKTSSARKTPSAGRHHQQEEDISRKTVCRTGRRCRQAAPRYPARSSHRRPAADRSNHQASFIETYSHFSSW